MTAVRNEENAYNISAIYLQVKENKEPVSAIPAPTGIYGGEFIVDGIKWDRASDMTVCSGELEIASSASGGYMEITFAGSRDRRDTWQHYRDIMAENMQAALVERDRVRLMARNHPAGKPSDDQPDNATSLAQSCESFLTHSVNALHAGYSMGRSVRYLKTNLLPLLTEAAEKCSEYGSVRFSDLLSVYSGCVLLGYEKVNMKRFCEKLVKNGIRDFVFDTLTRYPHTVSRPRMGPHGRHGVSENKGVDCFPAWKHNRAGSSDCIKRIIQHIRKCPDFRCDNEKHPKLIIRKGECRKSGKNGSEPVT